MTIGDPREPATEVGPLEAERQRRRVEDYIASGLRKGRSTRQPAQGWYLEPTVFADVDNRMPIAQEEISARCSS